MEVVTVAANIGVVAGIVFLAIELQQNTAANRILSSIAVNDSLAHLNESLHDNPELADMLHRPNEIAIGNGTFVQPQLSS